MSRRLARPQCRNFRPNRRISRAGFSCFPSSLPPRYDRGMSERDRFEPVKTALRITGLLFIGTGFLASISQFLAPKIKGAGTENPVVWIAWLILASVGGAILLESGRSSTFHEARRVSMIAGTARLARMLHVAGCLSVILPLTFVIGWELFRIFVESMQWNDLARITVLVFPPMMAIAGSIFIFLVIRLFNRRD